MFGAREVGHFPSWSFVLSLGFFLLYSFVFEVDRNFTLEKVSALKVFEGELTGNTGAQPAYAEGHEVENHVESAGGELESRDSGFESSRRAVSISPTNINKTILEPLVNLNLIELSHIYMNVESEYNSISSVSVVDNIEDCVSTKKSLNEILGLMLRARELLFSEEKLRNSPEHVRRDEKKRSWFKRGVGSDQKRRVKYSDLFFYVQANISIIRNTISLYNFQYKVFTTQEQILGGMSKLMSEISTLISNHKYGIKRRSTIEMQVHELNRKVSKIIGDYSSVLRKTHLFTSMKSYSSYSKNIQNYIQIIPCRLKYRLQNSMFDDLVTEIYSKFEEICQ